jgi:hypothetical protein
MALNPSVQTPRQQAARRIVALWTGIALLVLAAAVAVVLLFTNNAGVSQSAPASPPQSGGAPTAPHQPHVGPGQGITRPGLPAAE